VTAVETWNPSIMSNFEDLHLLHYYTYDLAHTLSLPGVIGRTWSDGVPKLAFEGDHDYLIHALLAAAAAHKVTRSSIPPNSSDNQAQRRGQEHYIQSLSSLQNLDLSTHGTHASAALAAIMLLTWYESLYECWENGIVVFSFFW
jgi:Fungal specific transcription factor domain